MKNSILSSKIRQLYDNCENYFDSFNYLIKHIIILDNGQRAKMCNFCSLNTLNNSKNIHDLYFRNTI